MGIKESILTHRDAFGFDFDETVVAQFEQYHGLVLERNPILHLVAPCDAEEFAIRHILESVTITRHLRRGAVFADIGPGGGFPAIPSLLARPDLRAILIESKAKKADFLSSAAERLGISDRVTVVNRQFEETSPDGADFITCRALDKFAEKLPRIVKWSNRRRMLLFGGPKIADALTAFGVDHRSVLMPLSDQRFLFLCEPYRQRIVSVK